MIVTALDFKGLCRISLKSFEFFGFYAIIYFNIFYMLLQNAAKYNHKEISKHFTINLKKPTAIA